MQSHKSHSDFTSTNLSSTEKELAYEEAFAQLQSILKDEEHTILKMATINCVLRQALPYYFWTGFYLVHKGALVVGPYQGTLAALAVGAGAAISANANAAVVTITAVFTLIVLKTI